MSLFDALLARGVPEVMNAERFLKIFIVVNSASRKDEITRQISQYLADHKEKYKGIQVDYKVPFKFES